MFSVRGGSQNRFFRLLFSPNFYPEIGNMGMVITIIVTEYPRFFWGTDLLAPPPLVIQICVSFKNR